MTFHDHLRHLAESALASIPAADVHDIYVVSFFIDNEADDPRQPTLTIGYNTEARFRRTIADASDEAEARWNCDGLMCRFGPSPLRGLGPLSFPCMLDVALSAEHDVLT